MTSPGNAPQIITRNLSFTFVQAVSGNGIPSIMEVVVTPLVDATSDQVGASFVGGPQRQTIELSAPNNIVTFALVPSNYAGLSVPINYRVTWRAGVLNRTFTYDFAMPDADTAFESLDNLGDIIDGQVYLQQSDLGVPGRVARLNDSGQVVDSLGNPVGTDQTTALAAAINAETLNRQAADSTLSSNLSTQINQQTAQADADAKAYANQLGTNAAQALLTEKTARQNADVALGNQIGTNTSALASVTSALATKASLVSGTVPVGQLPAAALTTAVSVANQAAMLALTSAQVQPGDMAVRPDGTFVLTAADPSQLGNWLGLSTITSVNGKRGVVVLGASDVGAIALGASITPTQVTGLTSALAALTPTTTTAALQTQVTGIANDPTTVHTASGTIADAILPTDVALINAQGFVTRKDGTVIVTTGGGAVASVNTKTGAVVLGASDVGAIAVGGAVTQSQVTGLSTTIAGLVSTTDARLSNARTPTAHAASHATGGSDPITPASIGALATSGTIALSQVTSLQTTLNNNASAISTLQTQVQGLGGGTSGVNIGPAVTWTASAQITETTAANFFASNNAGAVVLHSPWGLDTTGSVTGTVGTLYNTPAGALPGDVLWPYISPNGHLSLRQWNEANPPDPAYALQSAFSALSTTVGTLATQSALNTTNASVSALQTASAAKADLVSGTVPLNELPTNIPLASIATLTTALAAKADLSGGVLTSAQIPTNIPLASVATLTGALAAKADLSGGVLTLAQIPPLAVSNVTDLGTTLSTKADLTGAGGTLQPAQLPALTTSNLSDFTSKMAGYAPLTGGKISASVLPAGTITNGQTVSSYAGMLALSGVAPGDVAVVTGGSLAQQGTYLLNGADPTQGANWLQLAGNANAPVTSVNSKVGAVTLASADVGAVALVASGAQVPANGYIQPSQIQGYDLSTFETVGGVQTILDQTPQIRKPVVQVGTTAPPTPFHGLQTLDGPTAPAAGSRVLIADPNFPNTNGIWVTSTGTWTRSTDMPGTQFMVQGTLVPVSAGLTYGHTLWQAQLSGLVSTGSTFINIGSVAPPFVPSNPVSSGTSGVAFASSTSTFSVVPAPAVSGLSSGIQVGTAGVGVDASVARVFSSILPACVQQTNNGVTYFESTIAHNLGTSSLVVQVQDVLAVPPVVVAVGISISNQNIVVDFANNPQTGQYRVTAVGQ